MKVQIKESSFLNTPHSFKTNDNLSGKLIVDDDLALHFSLNTEQRGQEKQALK